jgi:hypothetical protein
MPSTDIPFNASANIIQNAIRQKIARKQFKKEKDKPKLSFNYNVDNYNTAYEVFGINEKSTQNEIKKKFYQLSKIYHPDKCGLTNKKELCNEMTKFINNIYEILKNDDIKNKYDTAILNENNTTRKKILKNFLNKKYITTIQSDFNEVILTEDEIKQLRYLKNNLTPVLDKNDIDFLKKYEKLTPKELDEVIKKNKKLTQTELDLIVEALKPTYTARVKMNYEF